MKRGEGEEGGCEEGIVGREGDLVTSKASRRRFGKLIGERNFLLKKDKIYLYLPC